MIGKDGVKRPDSISIEQVIQDNSQRFIANGKEIAKNGLAIGTGGNLSMRVPGGILITSTGARLSDIKPDEIVFVYAVEKDNVYFAGSKRPSSETITHWIIYQSIQNIKAISHVNAGPKDGRGITVTKEEIPYGTEELGYDTVEYLKAVAVLMLKNHGMFAVGDDLDSATRLVIDSADKNKPYVFLT
ncbi:MAG: class II aldolase/adducin family protein [Candidatus Marsarchaeota archaeon]|nr:class II aldolase/adducin family protein [Candidatus Marsarchaeota archaeon]